MAVATVSEVMPKSRPLSRKVEGRVNGNKADVVEYLWSVRIVAGKEVPNGTPTEFYDFDEAGAIGQFVKHIPDYRQDRTFAVSRVMA